MFVHALMMQKIMRSRDAQCNTEESASTIFLPFANLRWLNRVMQDHEARASDLNRKLIFSFFLTFS